MVSVGLASGSAQAQAFAQAIDEAEPVTLYVFKSATCPHCQAQRSFTDALAEHERVRAIYFEIMRTNEHHDLLRMMANAYDVRAGSVPMAFVADEVWVGDSPQIRSEIAKKPGHP